MAFPEFFDARAFQFCFYIRQIEEAYRTSARALNVNLSKHQQSLLELNRDNQSGNAVADADDGVTQHEILEYQIQSVQDALQSLREAFLMALYHHWERSVMRWTGVKDYDFRIAYKWVADEGLPLDRDRLETLRRLMKVIKHEKGGEQLRGDRLDLFIGGGCGHDDLGLTESHIDEFFKAVRGSGFQEPNPNG